MKITALLVSFFAASARGFTLAPTVASRSSSTRLFLLTPEETETLMARVNNCVNSECTVEDVDELVATLKQQQKDIRERVDKISNLLDTLKKTNTQDKREVDEIRETVRALFRVFQLGDKASGNNYPSLSKPSGWSGEVGKGPKTAYDALPPKPYKKP